MHSCGGGTPYSWTDKRNLRKDQKFKSMVEKLKGNFASRFLSEPVEKIAELGTEGNLGERLHGEVLNAIHQIRAEYGNKRRYF